ncbi:hypothetical protein Nepgr_007897 [Nepenthes gracilis]|uniref:Uncharacterized protein n=1 Tax=Nepenthes gracilis TaxID=150966 RepID=A0AAD3XIP7_NEPGR|nr:hypothetical protein Nepgr_007897 [Nepenthes gracilis]
MLVSPLRRKICLNVVLCLRHVQKVCITRLSALISAEVLEQAPPSCPPPPPIVSLSVVDVGCVVSSQICKHPNVASGEPLIGRSDPGSVPGVALLDCEDNLVDEAGLSSNVDHLDELDPVPLFSLLEGGNLEINQGTVGGIPEFFANVLKCGTGFSPAESTQPPPFVSPGLSILETPCVDPKSNNFEQHQSIFPNSDNKLKDLSPLAHRVAARINTLHRAIDKAAHKDEALLGLASCLAAYLSPRTLDSSLKPTARDLLLLNGIADWSLSSAQVLFLAQGLVGLSGRVCDECFAWDQRGYFARGLPMVFTEVFFVAAVRELLILVRSPMLCCLCCGEVFLGLDIYSEPRGFGTFWSEIVNLAEIHMYRSLVLR